MRNLLLQELTRRVSAHSCTARQTSRDRYRRLKCGNGGRHERAANGLMGGLKCGNVGRHGRGNPGRPWVGTSVDQVGNGNVGDVGEALMSVATVGLNVGRWVSTSEQ